MHSRAIITLIDTNARAYYILYTAEVFYSRAVDTRVYYCVCVFLLLLYLFVLLRWFFFFFRRHYLLYYMAYISSRKDDREMWKGEIE